MRISSHRTPRLDTPTPNASRRAARQNLTLRVPQGRSGSVGASTRRAGFAEEQRLLVEAGYAGLFQTLTSEHKAHLLTPFVMKGKDGPIVRAKESMLDAFVGPQTILSRRRLENRLESMGVEDPQIDRVALTNIFRVSKNEIRIPADQLQLLIQEQNLDDLSGRLNAPSGWPKVTLQNDKLTYRLPAENMLEMRGIRALVAEKFPEIRRNGRRPDANPAQIAEAVKARLVARGVAEPSVRVVNEDGKVAINVPAEQAEVLLEPVTALDPEAQVQEGKIPFNPQAQSFDPENNVFLAQLSSLVYENGRDAKEIERLAKTIGIEQPKLIEVNNSQALVGFVRGEDGAGSMVVVSRGSEAVLGDWVDNGRIAPRGIDFPDRRGDGAIHRGFMSYWDDLAPAVDAYYQENIGRTGLDPQKTTAVFTGHSLGGASSVAGWTRSALAQAEPGHDPKARARFTDLPVSQVYTYGQPRVVSGDLGRWLEDQMKDQGTVYAAIVNNRDLVTQVPPPPLYKHFSSDNRRAFNANGYLMEPGKTARRRDTFKGKIGESVRDHEMGRYLALARKHLQETQAE